MRASAATTKVVYCHSPARWLYQPDDYFKGHSASLKFLMSCVSPVLKRWDRAAARSADLYLANSRSVAQRIYHHYGIIAEVLHPPISLDIEGERVRPSACPLNFFLTVGRSRGYKNVSVLIEAFRSVPSETLVIVGSDDGIADLPRNVTFLSASDAELRWLYANATALISASNEDFGLTPLEANCFGTPAIVLRAGGFLDSLQEGITGVYFDSATPASILAAVTAFPTSWDRDAIKAHADRFTLPQFMTALRHQTYRARNSSASPDSLPEDAK